MPGGVLVDVVAIGGALGLWVLLHMAVLYVTRVRSVEPGAPTQDFGGDEPPAVVSLLVADWQITEDAVESTVIDLAARDFLEFRQPDDDARHTTIHVLDRDGSGLNPYEEQVLRRVRTLARDGVVPLTALTFRNPAEASAWDEQFRKALVRDSRARGLSRRRVPGAGVSLLVLAAALVALVVVAVMVRHSVSSDDGPGAGFGVGLVVWVILSGLAQRDRGERDTPAGRAAASRWLGLARHLRGDEVFATLPPASVAVWDRYLSYGTAVGAARVCSAVLDLGMGSRRLVWSAYGGPWHRVRISYPKLFSRYGMGAPRLFLGALWPLLLGGFMVAKMDVPLTGVTSDRLPDRVLSAIALVLILRGVYAFVRTVLDVATPVEVTGEVLWRESWRSKKVVGKSDEGEQPWSDYLAVDDGSGPSTKAWALPVREDLPWASAGDVVTMTVRRWSRRVVALAVVERKRSDPVVDVAEESPAVVPSTIDLSGLLVRPEELEAALGRPVEAPTATRLGPLQVLAYGTGGSVPLTVLSARGRIATMAMKARASGATRLEGLGDEAWSGTGFVWARVGETVVGVSYQNSTVAPTVAERLLRSAVARATTLA